MKVGEGLEAKESSTGETEVTEIVLAGGGFGGWVPERLGTTSSVCLVEGGVGLEGLICSGSEG